MPESPEKLVEGWLTETGIGYKQGGVSGPTVDWAVSIVFGGTTHVSIAHDTDHPNRLEVMSDLTISDDHRTEYHRLSKAEQSSFDNRVLGTLLRRAAVNFNTDRDERGAFKTIRMRARVPVSGLTPQTVLSALYETRNMTMELCIDFQAVLGLGRGIAIDRALTDPAYTNVILEKGTLEVLSGFQIPGETIDETILRAVRE